MDPVKFGGEYATYVPSRSPKFKVHGTKGQAQAAVRHHGYHWRSEDSDSTVLVFVRIGETWKPCERVQGKLPPKGTPLWEDPK